MQSSCICQKCTSSDYDALSNFVSMHHDRMCVLRRATLGRAGKAFEGLEALLGGGRSGTFDLQASALSAHVCMSPNECPWALPGSIQTVYKSIMHWQPALHAVLVNLSNYSCHFNLGGRAFWIMSTNVILCPCTGKPLEAQRVDSHG